ncbi:hypothetical protein Tco_0738733 [Tanacetum coccineum]
MPQDSLLPRFNTLGSDEGSMTLQELMVLCITLSNKVESLETDLKQTKLTYGAAYTKLIKKEDPSKQGRKIAKIDQDPAISLVQHDTEIQGRYEHDVEFDFDLDAAKDVSTAKKDVSTAKPVSTAGVAVTTASVAAVSTAKDKGKGKMDESEPVHTKTKLQQEQERLSYEADIRLQAEHEEEERQRIARVHEAASSFNVKEWEDMQARVKAVEELAQRLQGEEKEMYTEAEQARMLVELINQRKRDAEEELDQESSKRQKIGESSEPAEEPKDKEKELFTLKALGSTRRSSELEIILREGNIHLHAGREGVSIVKKNSYTDTSCKALGGTR